jgi:hypothetical protein
MADIIPLKDIPDYTKAELQQILLERDESTDRAATIATLQQEIVDLKKAQKEALAAQKEAQNVALTKQGEEADVLLANAEATYANNLIDKEAAHAAAITAIRIENEAELQAFIAQANADIAALNQAALAAKDVAFQALVAEANGKIAALTTANAALKTQASDMLKKLEAAEGTPEFKAKQQAELAALGLA